MSIFTLIETMFSVWLNPVYSVSVWELAGPTLRAAEPFITNKAWRTCYKNEHQCGRPLHPGYITWHCKWSVILWRSATLESFLFGSSGCLIQSFVCFNFNGVSINYSKIKGQYNIKNTGIMSAVILPCNSTHTWGFTAQVYLPSHLLTVIYMDDKTQNTHCCCLISGLCSLHTNWLML